MDVEPDPVGDNQEQDWHRHAVPPARADIGGEQAICLDFAEWVAEVVAERAVIVPRPGNIDRLADSGEFEALGGLGTSHLAGSIDEAVDHCFVGRHIPIGVDQPTERYRRGGIVLPWLREVQCLPNHYGKR